MPRKLGQHFLKDRTVLHKIVQAIGLISGESVLEIGPGQGVLTRELSATGATVTAVELDAGLVSRLRQEFPEGGRVEIVEANALEIEPCRLMPPRYKLAGNIPYYITGALLRKFLTAECKPERAVLMVQMEVARRMLAQPGEMSLLSVSTQLYTEPGMVTRVPPGAFNPPPKVDSAVVRLDIRPLPRVEIPDEAVFFEVARAGFGTKRKQLVNALAHGLERPKADAAAMLETAGIMGTSRAEELSLEEWGRLAWAYVGVKEPESGIQRARGNGPPLPPSGAETVQAAGQGEMLARPGRT